jgi:DNA-binding response OmpR family regulator
MHAPDTCPHRAPRILVIDDEADLREMLDLFLSSVGYEVCTAESGRVAIEQAKRQAIDLVITDLRMPGMSGVDTLTALRRMSPSLAVIVLSGHVSEEAAQRCSEEGATRIVLKPFHLDDLLHVVDGALRASAPARRSR